MTSGRFITFEGGEGTGKSTQTERLAERLRSLGNSVVLTREPGGSPGGELIRDLLLADNPEPYSALTETLLFYAARSDHIEKTIGPALQNGNWVISDRFSDSTRAYQGAAGGLSPATIETLEDIVVGTSKPDLTFLLDLPVEEGLARTQERKRRSHKAGRDRFESRDIVFHERLRAAYLNIAQNDPSRFFVIDGSQSEDVVEHAIWDIVKERFNL